MRIGHQFLEKEFGIKPTIGWMMDSFGHSEANAALYSDFGFDALFFARISKELKVEYKKDKKMTFLWQPMKSNHGSDKQILTYILYNHYQQVQSLTNENYIDIYQTNSIDFNLDAKCIDMQNYINLVVDA